ncbi:MAG TPA: RNA 2',3'-cyclic phosphodiesterase [Methylomirabilota bacterium]|nr:RNA 2',3'-cyclic phosphodiesterase [Methylomirabilota bacterium]
MAGLIRSFIAILLDEPTRAAVAAEIERLQALTPPRQRAVAWVPRQNLHLTLKFLGEQSPERLGDARAALEEAAGTTAPFALNLHGTGAFPGLERPRVLWVGVAEGALEARALQSRVEQALGARGFAREARPWHPHLTIGRVFDPRRWQRDAGPALREALARGGSTAHGRLTVSRVSLMRSDLSPSGARYSELDSLALGGV